MDYEALVAEHLAKANGDPAAAYESMRQMRYASPDALNNPVNAQAEHALYSMKQIHERPLLGRMSMAVGTPLWAGMKAGVQRLPQGAQQSIDQRMPADLKPGQGTPPSWAELMAGLRPIFGGMSVGR